MGWGELGGITPQEQAKLDSLPKAYFEIHSVDPIAISTDPDNPTYITGCVLDKANGFTIENAAIGSAFNDSGRDMSFMLGNVTLQLNNGTGGTATLKLWSERSNDGFATFTENNRSLRSIPITNSTEASQTKSSQVLDMPQGYAVRFAMYNASGGNLSLVAPTDVVNGGAAIGGESFSWVLIEA